VDGNLGAYGGGGGVNEQYGMPTHTPPTYRRTIMKRLNEDLPPPPPPPPAMPAGYPGGQEEWDADYHANRYWDGPYPGGHWTWNYYVFVDGRWAQQVPPPGDPGNSQFVSNQQPIKRSRPTPYLGGGGDGGAGGAGGFGGPM